MCLFPFGTIPLASVAVLSINILGIVILLLVGMEWGRAQARKGAVADTRVAAESVS